jgi:hypothetical protein
LQQKQARHLLHGEALRAQARRIHQVLRLIIGHQPDAAAAVVERAQPGERRRLACSQETPNHHEPQPLHRRSPCDARTERQSQ